MEEAKRQSKTNRKRLAVNGQYGAIRLSRGTQSCIKIVGITK